MYEYSACKYRCWENCIGGRDGRAIFSGNVVVVLTEVVLGAVMESSPLEGTLAAALILATYH